MKTYVTMFCTSPDINISGTEPVYWIMLYACIATMIQAKHNKNTSFTSKFWHVGEFAKFKHHTRKGNKCSTLCQFNTISGKQAPESSSLQAVTFQGVLQHLIGWSLSIIVGILQTQDQPFSLHEASFRTLHRAPKRRAHRSGAREEAGIAFSQRWGETPRLPD